MSCDVVRTSQRQICSDTDTSTPCLISISKMNISRTMTGKQTVGFTRNSRNTFVDSMERVPTCSLLKSSVAICVCLFGNMFIGKNKNPLFSNNEREMKAIQYIRDFKLSAGDTVDIGEEAGIKDDQGLAIERQSSMEQRRELIERAEKKLQQLTSLHRDSWDIYRLLMTENLEDSPLKDNVKKIQLLLTRVTKFVTFAHGKLDSLKTCTLLELIEILEELEHVLKLTSDMRLAKGDHSQTSQDNLNCKTENDENGNSKYQVERKEISQNSARSSSTFSESSQISVQTVINKYSTSRMHNHKIDNSYLRLKNENKSVKKADEKNGTGTQQFGWGDIHVDLSSQTNRCEFINDKGLRCKERSVYAGMKHSISRFVASADIEQRVKSTISHIEALGQIDTKIDKNRLEKIFGKIGRVEGETSIKKPTKTKLEHITREFVRIKDTIVRLIKLNRGAKQDQDEAGAGDVGCTSHVGNRNNDTCQDIEKSHKSIIEYENKLEQLNKKLEEIRTAYDLLRTISIGTLTQRSKRTEVKRLMTDLNTITQELNKIQPTFVPKNKEKTAPEVNNLKLFKESTCTTNKSLYKENKQVGVSIAIDTSGTAGMQWPNPRYQAVLYNYDWDEQSQSQHETCKKQIEKSATENQSDSMGKSVRIPGDKGTQTRLDTISSWIEKNKAGEVVYEDSCIVTIGQPVRRTRSVNIINQESRKLATQKLQCQSSESIVTTTKSKQNENCRNRFKELLKVGRGFFERSCKKNMEKTEALPCQPQENKCLQGQCAEKVVDSCEKNKSDKNSTEVNCSGSDNAADKQESSFTKGILTVRNVQTSYDSFLVKPELMCVDIPSGKSNYTCYESDRKVKEAVENALAGIESAYSLALREFIGRLNSQGINIRMDCYSKSTSTTGLLGRRSHCSSYKYSRMESKISKYSYRLNGEIRNSQIDYISQISVDAISIASKSQSGSRKSSKRVPLPMSSRTRLADSSRTEDTPEEECLIDYISSFDNSFNSSILLIQNNNFK